MKGHNESKDLSRVTEDELNDGDGNLGGEEDILTNPGNTSDSNHKDSTGPDEDNCCDASILCHQHSYTCNCTEKRTFY